jgi:hypothetical protein
MPHQQQLLFGANHLEDAMPLSYYGIVDGARVQLVFPMQATPSPVISNYSNVYDNSSTSFAQSSGNYSILYTHVGTRARAPIITFPLSFSIIDHV